VATKQLPLNGSELSKPKESYRTSLQEVIMAPECLVAHLVTAPLLEASLKFS